MADPKRTRPRTRRRCSARRPHNSGVAAALLGLALLSSACSSGTASDVPSPTEAPETAQTAPNTVAGSVETEPEVSATAAIDPRQALEEALLAYADGYSFTAEVRVADTLATAMSGRVVGSSSEIQIVSGGAALDYVSTPDGRWVREGTVWVQLDEKGSAEPPLAQLQSPDSIEVVDQVGDVVHLLATYQGLTLGVPDVDELDVAITIANGRLVAITYTVDLSDGQAVTATAFSPLSSTSVITTPLSSA